MRSPAAADGTIPVLMAHHLELLACVARSDGDVSVEEALAIRSFMDAAGTSLGDIQQVSLLLDKVDVERVVSRLAEEATAWTLAEAVRDAYIIASADGEVTNHEISTVERLFELLDLPVEHRAKLHTWGRNAAAQQLLGMTFISASLDHVQARRDTAARRDGGTGRETRVTTVKRSVHKLKPSDD